MSNEPSSPESFQHALVIGDGSWGTALAILLARSGAETTLWSRSPERSKAMAESRENTKYLPGVELPENMRFSADPFAAAEGAQLALSVVPTQFLRAAIERFEDALPGDVPVVSSTKGIEIESFRTPLEILEEVLGERPLGVLTGPSHAEEVSRGLPASLVMASSDAELGKRVQATLSSGRFRLYTSDDPRGAELAGALKNVIALAAGISDGLAMGDNAKSALITRGIVEMARFGQQQGASPSTFFGLAGIGDLMTTCYSKHSRNRAVGEKLGAGQSLEQILEEMQMVAEGVWTTRALFGPEADARGTAMPIAEQVHRVLFEGVDPRSAVDALMTRAPSGEMDGLLPVNL